MDILVSYEAARKGRHWAEGGKGGSPSSEDGQPQQAQHDQEGKGGEDGFFQLGDAKWHDRTLRLHP